MPTTYAATDKQLAYIDSLVNQTGTSLDELPLGFSPDTEYHTLTKNQASQVIDALLAAKSAAKSAAKATAAFSAAYQGELESGMYRKNGVIYKVYKTVHGAGTMCAKELVERPVPAGEPRDFEFVYRGLAAKHGIKPEHRMTLDEAKQFGAIYGVCCVCSATLTQEESIEAGIGPVCGGKV